MSCNSTITDLFLFVFTQLILHYRVKHEVKQKDSIVCYTRIDEKHSNPIPYLKIGQI